MIESADEFKRLRESEDPEEYRRAAHESASMEVWNSVLEKYPELAFWVAQNKTVPIEILVKLSQHSDSAVRHMVASKRKLPEYLMLAMVKDKDESVRLALASNPKASSKVLEELLKDSWVEVRKVAAKRLAL